MPAMSSASRGSADGSPTLPARKRSAQPGWNCGRESTNRFPFCYGSGGARSLLPMHYERRPCHRQSGALSLLRLF